MLCNVVRPKCNPELCSSRAIEIWKHDSSMVNVAKVEKGAEEFLKVQVGVSKV